MVPRGPKASPPWEPPPKRKKLIRSQKKAMTPKGLFRRLAHPHQQATEAGQHDRQDRAYTIPYNIANKERIVADTHRTPKRAKGGFQGRRGEAVGHRPRQMAGLGLGLGLNQQGSLFCQAPLVAEPMLGETGAEPHLLTFPKDNNRSRIHGSLNSSETLIQGLPNIQTKQPSNWRRPLKSRYRLRAHLVLNSEPVIQGSSSDSDQRVDSYFKIITRARSNILTLITEQNPARIPIHISSLDTLGSESRRFSFSTTNPFPLLRQRREREREKRNRGSEPTKQSIKRDQNTTKKNQRKATQLNIKSHKG